MGTTSDEMDNYFERIIMIYERAEYLEGEERKSRKDGFDFEANYYEKSRKGNLSFDLWF